MIFDNGVTQLTFDPMTQSLSVEDRSNVMFNNAGKVIAVGNMGLAPKRTRQLELRLTTAQLATYKTFFNGLAGASFKFTDSVGRVWNAQWTEDFTFSEESYSTVGWYRLTVKLWLLSVFSDSGRIAYSNVDHGMMNMLVAGGAMFYWPLAYTHALDSIAIDPTQKIVTPGFLETDATRFTARTDLTSRYNDLPDEFVSALEDYYVNTLQGAVMPFTLTHFRDGAIAYRWLSGISMQQSDNLKWNGTIQLRGEI